MGQTSEVSQAADPFIGTWELNLEKSEFEPSSSAPRITTRTVEDRGDGLFLVTRHGINAQGNRSFAQYAYKRDGKDYPIAELGAQTAYSISIRRVDAHTEEFTVKSDGRWVSTGTTTISGDGKTMTRNRRGTNEQGQETTSVQVYERR